MKRSLIMYITSLPLLISSMAIHAEPEIIIARIQLVADDHILIDRNINTSKMLQSATRRNASTSEIKRLLENRIATETGPGKYQLVTEENAHLSPYSLTEFWINTKKSDFKTFKGIGFTHAAEITIEDDTVKKIRTLDDFIL